MPERILIEICVDSVASAMAAERGGADRIELCADMLEGGITPSLGIIERVCSSVSIPVNVMVRPRGGDFLYDPDELDIMRRDILMMKNAGAAGLVLGALDADGKIDVATARSFVELARPLSVTFHRAFDMSADLLRALEDVCTTGAERILTSGGEQTALQGARMIAAIVKAARGRIGIMAGSGIRPENVRQFITETGVQEIHAGMASRTDGPMRFRNPRIAMGAVPGREYQRSTVLEENVRKLREAVISAK